MTAAYKAEEAVQGMRGRWIPAGELQASEQQLEGLGADFKFLTEDEKQAYIQRGVIYRRAEFFKADFDAVFDAIPRARAYFDDKVLEALRSFPKARNRILSAADILPMMSKPVGQEDSETYQSIRSAVFGIPINGKDEIGDMVTDALATLECTLGGKLKHEGTND